MILTHLAFYIVFKIQFYSTMCKINIIKQKINDVIIIPLEMLGTLVKRYDKLNIFPMLISIS